MEIQASDTGMMIVEIPAPDISHVADAALRATLASARDSVKTDLHLKKEPSRSGMPIGKAYMEVVGALYFDAPHYPNCASRGEKMNAATCWEIHPVIAVRNTPRP